MNIINSLAEFVKNMAFAHISWQECVMIFIGLLFIWLAIKKGFEPLLLLPIAFGMILANIPLGGIMDAPSSLNSNVGGLLYYLYQGDALGIFPPIIFMGIGAMTDFGPLIANPKSLWLGAAAQFGVFIAFWAALLLSHFVPFLNYTAAQASSIGIIGGADGPTAIWLATKLAPELLGPIALSAYSYMSLVPIIIPPVAKLLTTKRERQIEMHQLKPVSKTTKILFPIINTIIIAMILPPITPLIGMLMLGNLFRESGVVERLSDTAQNALINIVTIFLGVTVGATANGQEFLKAETVGIFFLGIVAFSFAAGGGVLVAKLMNLFLKEKINPLIGAAGVSAVPMSARVVHKMGQKENPRNFLLMHAMGPNVAGVIGTAVAAGYLYYRFIS